MIRKAIIYKPDASDLAVSILADDEHICTIYGDDYSICGFMIGTHMRYNITITLRNIIVGCAPVEDYICELWKGVSVV